jgi:hypothetical protein
MTALIVIALIVLLGVALLVFLSGIALYARLVGLRRTVTSSWSEMDITLKKRYDLATKLANISPDDKETAVSQGLEAQLSRLEDDVSAAVRTYNTSVQNYNIATGTFPAQIVAKLFNLERAEFFDTTISQRV